jgi:hypothetical protein
MTWRAGIRIGGKKENLGSYMVEEEAATAYDLKSLHQLGLDAKTNFPVSTY